MLLSKCCTSLVSKCCISFYVNICHWKNNTEKILQTEASFKNNLFPQQICCLPSMPSYGSIKVEHFYTAFISLKEAFDLVNRPLLIQCLMTAGV